MTFAFDEQPPEGESEELREWLARLTTEIAIASNTPNGFGGGVNNNPHLYMRWAGIWTAGRYYRKGDVVHDTEFVMICINDTFDRAAPQPDGLPTWSMPDAPLWNNENDPFENVKGTHQYVFNQSGWVSEARVWGPTIGPQIEYHVIFDTDTGDHVRQAAVVDNDVWSPVTFIQQIVKADSTLNLTLETIDTAGITDYVEIPGRWPANNPIWADVTSSLLFDDVLQPAHNNFGFGVDILFQQAQFSPDWEVVSLP